MRRPGEDKDMVFENLLGEETRSFSQGIVISPDLYKKAKRFVAMGLMENRVRIQDEGYLELRPGDLDEIGSRYLRATRNETVETWWSQNLFMVPLVRLNVTPGFLICLILFLALTGLALYSWNFERWNDLLIETQTEMKKVSWPKRHELIGSSAVVIFCVLVLGIFLYIVDIVLTTIAERSGLLR